MSKSLLKYFATSILTIILLFLYGTESNTCNFNVKLTQTLNNDGFHRNITYEIQFGAHDGMDGYEGCSAGLEQVLPPGLYASPDEIDDARYKTTTVFKNKVNIELPAHEASPLTVHLLGSVRDGRTFLFLPAHARYHRAVPGGGTARVEIPPPQLYLNCGPRTSEQCGPDHNVVNSFCPKSAHKCFWKQVDTMVSEPPVWNVPVGNTDHHNLVMLGTAAVVAFGSLYLIKEIHCFKLRQQKKKKR